MKIILSPSKTASYQTIAELPQLDLLYPTRTKKLVSTIRKMNQTTLSKALHVNGDLLKQTYHEYKNFYKSPGYQAFPSFTGLVFKQLDRDHYTSADYHYIQTHVRIFDALYGVLTPGTLIKPYRLDMKSSLGFNLYSYWDVDDAFEDELIINLASNEFSKMMSQPMISIEFYTTKNGRLQSLATYSKMARGQMLNYLIKHHITTRDGIQQFDCDNYRYDPTRSTADTYVFIR
ncbi:YaaA family protein [Candidatus Xianfuyuplasma coldseepsis]|uniref:UPF0246 protein G4Z02_08890 n=1 Tax=Candidatus Xianfuyuplasma coldseepsis TaxID=2782163 RepID=A0A7L7KT27_9MOLU|nr:YaaA family protein [Xianfuyuplasma coldseepsis]QMS85857.1 YaaA family protein [Xianfuyuplasma coldseepsis]